MTTTPATAGSTPREMRDMATPKQPPHNRRCLCGCGAPITTPRAYYLPECRRRLRGHSCPARAAKSLPGRVAASPKRLAGEPMKPKRLLCKVCFDTALPDRGAGTCPSCGRTYEADLVEAAE
jgi:hypothetical protein